jgi:hypothetical protein
MPNEKMVPDEKMVPEKLPASLNLSSINIPTTYDNFSEEDNAIASINNKQAMEKYKHFFQNMHAIEIKNYQNTTRRRQQADSFIEELKQELFVLDNELQDLNNFRNSRDFRIFLNIQEKQIQELEKEYDSLVKIIYSLNKKGSIYGGRFLRKTRKFKRRNRRR